MARDRASRPGAKPLRLFVAADVPPGTRESVAAALAPVREMFPLARWVPPGNWHVTLKFLGATYPRLSDWVRERVGETARGCAPFTMRAWGLGSFPSPTRARVLWVGLEDGGAMATVAEALDVALAEEVPRETRPFAAHLTVARSDPPLRLPAGFCDGIEVVADPFPVREIVLYRSHLRRPAPVYEPLARLPLGS